MSDDVKKKGASDLISSDENAKNPEMQDVPEPSKVKSNVGTPQGISADSENDTKETTYAFTDLNKTSTAEPPDNIEFILDIPLEISVELGRTKMLISDLLKLGQGSIIGLSKLAGETLEILANQKLIARGEVVVLDEKYGIRLIEIASPTERIEGLK